MGGPGYGGPHPGYRQYAHHHGRGGFPGGGGFGGFGFGGFGFGQPPPIESETKTVTVHQLLAMLEKRQPVVVQVFHDASDACVRFAPVWDATARAMDGAAAFVRVDGNADGRLAHQLAQHPALSAMVGGARLAISELPVVVGFTGRCGASLACAHRFRGERSGAALAGFAAGWLVAALPRLPLLDVKGLKAFLAANRDKARRRRGRRPRRRLFCVLVAPALPAVPARPMTPYLLRPNPPAPRRAWCTCSSSPAPRTRARRPRTGSWLRRSGRTWRSPASRGGARTRRRSRR